MFKEGAKFLGHPIHQMLIVFPLGLLATSVVFDIVARVAADGKWAEIAFWMIAAGVLGGLLAAVFGLIDWLALPDSTRAKSVGLWHGLTMAVVVALFAVSWFLRQPAPAALGTAPFVLSLVGAGLALLGGWLGGELVDRLGVGVDQGAHPNAPSSLSGRPASENIAGYERGTGHVR